MLEVFGLCFFAVVILLQTNFSPGLCVLMMNGVFIFPVLWQVYKNRPSQEQYSCKQLTFFIIAFILEMAGVAIFMSQVRVWWVGSGEGGVVEIRSGRGGWDQVIVG